MIRKYFLALLAISILPKSRSLSNYLDSLSGIQIDPAPPGPPMPEDIVPEEYFGFTNPMANNWPGSKHEKYGGYLKKLLPKNVNDDSSRPAPNAWQHQSTPKRPRQGNYLENL